MGKIKHIDDLGESGKAMAAKINQIIDVVNNMPEKTRKQTNEILREVEKNRFDHNALLA